MVAFYLPGGIPVYTFSILLGLGGAAGLAWAAWQAPAKTVPGQINAGLWALMGALLGGRLAFIFANAPYFRQHPLEAAQTFQGGLSWPGALAGGLLALALYSGLTRRSLGLLADGLLPLVAVLSVNAWLGCWLDGCAYGMPAVAGWGLPARDEWGEVTLRWPVQLVGALFCLAFFWLLDRLRPRLRRRSAAYRPGSVASLGLLGLSLHLLASSFLRADPAPLWRHLRLDTWAALAFAGLALVTLLLTSTLQVERSRE